MSDPYVGEIRSVGFNFAPVGWAICDGSLLSIAEYETLFTLIGTTYGGDGQTTFALPDLRGRIAVHQGSGYVIGQKSGTETVTLSTSQVPPHQHAVAVNTGAATTSSPANAVLAAPGTGELYLDDTPTVPMKAGTVGTAGGNQPHTNMPPYLTVNFIISLFGIFPSQT